MALTATQLASTVLATTSEITVYTAPGGTTTMVQHIVVVNDDGSSITLTIKVNGKLLRKAVTIAAGDVLEWKGFLVLNAGETLKMTASTGAVANVSVGGVEIT